MDEEGRKVTRERFIAEALKDIACSFALHYSYGWLEQQWLFIRACLANRCSSNQLASLRKVALVTDGMNQIRYDTGS